MKMKLSSRRAARLLHCSKSWTSKNNRNMKKRKEIKMPTSSIEICRISLIKRKVHPTRAIFNSPGKTPLGQWEVLFDQNECHGTSRVRNTDQEPPECVLVYPTTWSVGRISRLDISRNHLQHVDTPPLKVVFANHAESASAIGYVYGSFLHDIPPCISVL